MAPPPVDSKILFSLIFSLDVHVSIFFTIMDYIITVHVKHSCLHLKKACEVIKGRRISAAKIIFCPYSYIPECLSIRMLLDFGLLNGVNCILLSNGITIIKAVLK